MSTTRDVAVLVGSLRKESFNRKMANALVAMAPAPLKLEIVEIRQLPLYNQDDDANPPAASAAFKQRVQKADAVLFLTPEYNRSMPGVLKNAIDIASRPYGKSAWNGKPGDQRLSGRDWRLRREPPPAPVARVPERPGLATAGSVHRQCRQALR
jgi:chromate reductase, NAD(P)H dehydrogenase (quinone)